MTTVAVVAHSKKILGGGLDELRTRLVDAGVDPLWYEVPKSKKAPKAARQALKAGADLVFVWGGDGTVQRCIDTLGGTGVTIAILPAGTANLLANNLGVPIDLAEAVQVGLHGRRRKLDTGLINGERFAVMAGAGFDAEMIHEADRGLKDRTGRLAYVWTGVKATKQPLSRMRVKVDGELFFDGAASCVLFGNVGTATGGLCAFPDARPDDGWLEVGVVTADGPLQWGRVVSRMATSHPEKSKYTRSGRGRKIDVKLDKPLRYELDGGARPKVDRLKVRIDPESITICVPEEVRS